MLASGCSFIFAARPREAGDRLDSSNCALGYVPPVLDSMWAGLQAVTLGSALSSTPAEWDRRHQSSRTATAYTSALQIAVFGASAAYGFYQAARCVRSQHEQQVAAH